jgi:predicted nucleic acid-binding protein
MKKILIDTNIILDLALERHPFYKDAVIIFEKIDRKQIKGYVSASAITDIYYFAKKEKGQIWASTFLLELSEIIEIASVDKNVVIKALKLGWNDFEDALQTLVAVENEFYPKQERFQRTKWN